MDNGIVYVVFGKDYDLLAAHAIAYSRQFTDLPIHVLTNIQNRCDKWDEIENVTFRVVRKRQHQNREIKTCMQRYTPFKKTLYLDCDSVIQRPGIEQVFEMLNGHDIVLSLYLDWKEDDKVVRIARKVMNQARVRLPLKIYCGAFICWNSSNKKVTRGFFPEWNKLWIKTGKGRELFQLCCAAKKVNLKVKKLMPQHKMFHPNHPTDYIVQHNYNSVGDKHFHQEFGLPRMKAEYKPFDTDPTDWNWVDFEVKDV